MLSWFSLLLISTFLAAITAIFQKVILDNKADPIFFSSYWQLITAFISVISVLLFGFEADSIKILVFAFICTGLFYGLGTYLFFIGLKNAEASMASIMNQVRVIWVLIGSFIFFKEQITLNKLGGVSLIIAGIFIVFHKGLSLRLKRPQRLILLSTLFFSLGMLADKYFINFFNSYTYLVIDFLAPSLFIIIISPQIIKDYKNIKPFSKNNILTVLVACVFFGSILAMLTAYKLGAEVSIAVPIFQSAVVLVVLLSAVFLGERDNLFRKMIGSLVTVFGVCLLSL
ncbi:DMT family transporter [Candidatus Woesearchaeota archaeon]|nr:DMT family transporter [Candidatus Woesearchaeota archaeon]